MGRYIILVLFLNGCAITTPTGVAINSTEPHIEIHITRGDHSTEISFQGDSVLAEKEMMFEVMDKIQSIHIYNLEHRDNNNNTK